MKRHPAILLALLLLVASQPVLAKAPSRSMRPDMRPETSAPANPAVRKIFGPSIVAALLPRPRPVTAPKPARVVLSTAGAAVHLSQRPSARPANFSRNVVRAAVRSKPAKPVPTSRAGSVCGDKTIRGQTLSPIAGRLRGCGVSAPVKITSIDGVALTQPATVNCDTARALKKWVKNTVKPTVGKLGGGVVSLRVVAHYSCRTRNNQPGAKISEHGRGNAIDIAAINLKNGVSLAVLKGWRDKTQGPILKKVHARACGTFGTVLGPNSDRFHQDHLHLDVARHRGGAYCR
ncbi:MAG: extensin family protein [Rhodobacter sp.]|nr:extensin family protein [Rhodobacter sp.]